MRRACAAAALALVCASVAGCGGSGSSSSGSTGSTGATASTAAATSCAKTDLTLVKPGKLTIGTDNPAFPPWFGGGSPQGSTWKINDPHTGKGFESAVAYAVAGKLGFAKPDVDWVVVPFNTSFAPGKKKFDFDINQISFTPARAKVVDFSSSYYDVNQALVAVKGTKIAGVTAVSALKPYKLGAQLGTTSFSYIQDTIQPSQKPAVFDTNDAAVSALKNGQIDGLVVDLPTAFFVTAVQVPNGKIVGQFPSVGGQEHFGMVFAKGNSLVKCVNDALAGLRADGKLAAIQKQWLSKSAGAPVLK